MPYVCGATSSLIRAVKVLHEYTCSNNLCKDRAILTHLSVLSHEDNPVYTVKKYLQCRQVQSILQLFFYS